MFKGVQALAATLPETEYARVMEQLRMDDEEAMQKQIDKLSDT